MVSFVLTFEESLGDGGGNTKETIFDYNNNSRSINYNEVNTFKLVLLFKG